MKHASPILNVISGLLLAALTCTAAALEPTQQPLLTRASAVSPNLLILFDDSDSMAYGHLYTAAIRSDPARWYGPNPTAQQLLYLSGDHRPLNADSYAYCSPDINRIAYHPDKRYQPMKKVDGTLEAQGSVTQMLSELAANTTTMKNCKFEWYSVKYPVVLRHVNKDVINEPTNKDIIYESTKYDALAIIPGRAYIKTSRRADCANATYCTYEEEIQNYANWWFYHRTRLDVFKTALSHAIVAVPDSLRLGYAGINQFSLSANLAMAPVPLGFRFAPAEVPLMGETSRHLFYKILKQQGTSPGTMSNLALVRAGLFFARNDSDGPWGTWPNPYSLSQASPASTGSTEPKSSHASCRRSYAMLATDGYYSEIYNIGEKDSVKGSPVPHPRGGSYVYEPVPPYSSPHYGMADIAMHFWREDLRPDLPNNVEPIKGDRGDPAFWQHLNFMAVTLGLDGTLERTKQTLDDIKTGGKSWPAPAVISPQAMDDIWHATINGRGDLINVTDAEEMTQAFNTLVSGILRASATQGGVAASTVRLTTSTKKFVPVFTSGQWTGNLIATALDAKTGKEEDKPLWQVETTDTDTGEELSNKLGPHADRNITVGTGAAAGVGPKAVPFKHADMSDDLRNRVSTTDAANLINYLRGDRTYEAGPNNTYRKRAFILGDIVNSNPTFVGPDIDQGYSKLANATNAASYNTYLGTKRERAEGLIFIGANDGMLHAFRESDGKEVFAYVPHAVMPQLHKLARKDYEHRYFVDGPTSQGDWQRPNGTWRTAVLASAGAGAKSVFAIDATTNTLGASSVMWEVHSGMAGFEEMGNVLSEVRMGRRNGGIHFAFFGNGYYSASGKAQLFVVNMNTGALVTVLDTKAGDNNGLGGVELVLDDNNIVVGAYAGDLKGNLWKFDMRSSDANDWKVSTNPVFKAKTSAGAVQPITAAPLSIKHPQGGRVVVVGTGRFFDAADVTTKDPQAIYGVRDKEAFANMGSASIDGVSTLIKQELITKQASSRVVTAFDDTTSTHTVTYYEVSVNPIDWSVKDGWYFNQPFDGQRMVYPVTSFVKGLAKVDTIVPGAQSSDACTAATPGTGYNYIIDILTGGTPQGPFLDTNGDNVVDSKDISASGYSTSLDGRDQVLQVGNGGDFVIVDSSGGSQRLCAGCGSSKTVKSRSWQQLFLR